MSQTQESFFSRVDRVELFYMLLSLLGVSEFGRCKSLQYSRTPSNESKALQALEPKAREPVVDDVARVRPVEKVAYLPKMLGKKKEDDKIAVPAILKCYFKSAKQSHYSIEKCGCQSHYSIEKRDSLRRAA